MDDSEMKSEFCGNELVKKIFFGKQSAKRNRKSDFQLLQVQSFILQIID